MIIDDNLVVRGTIKARRIAILPTSVGDENVPPLNYVDVDKQEHRYAVAHANGTSAATVTNELIPIHQANAPGIVVGFYATIKTAGSSSSDAIVDLLKNGSSILSTTISVPYNATPFVSLEGTIDTALDDYENGDVFEIQITANGNTTKGLTVTLVVDEQVN
jgi:hypothetical protein